MPTYKIKKGDTLSEIARRKGTTVTALKKENPGVDPRKLRIGQTINLPYNDSGGGSSRQSGGGYSNGSGPPRRRARDQGAGKPPASRRSRGRPQPQGGQKRAQDALSGLLSSIGDAIAGAAQGRQTMIQGKKRLAQSLANKGVEGTQKDIKELWFDVLDKSHEKYEKDSVEGDAYRHYESSRRTAQKYGPMAATAVGVQHELKNALDFARGEYSDDFGIGDLLAASGQDMVNNLRGVFDGTTGREPASPSNLSQMDRTYKGR